MKKFLQLFLSLGLVLTAVLSMPVSAFENSSGLGVITVAELPKEGRDTLALIRKGGPFPYAKDGTVFSNRERVLPKQPRGVYREYTVKTPGSASTGTTAILPLNSAANIHALDDTPGGTHGLAELQDRFVIVDDVLLPLLATFRAQAPFEKVFVVRLTDKPLPEGVLDYESLVAPVDASWHGPALDERQAGRLVANLVVVRPAVGELGKAQQHGLGPSSICGHDPLTVIDAAVTHGSLGNRSARAHARAR